MTELTKQLEQTLDDYKKDLCTTPGQTKEEIDEFIKRLTDLKYMLETKISILEKISRQLHLSIPV
ncbi:MAG: hypothetical protein WCX88_04150 [Patescibacteria group bacterium]